MKKYESREVRITIRLHSHLEYTGFFHNVISWLADELGISEERRDWIALSLREAVNNAVLHGNANDLSKWIEVEFQVAGDTLLIKVWDEGEGFPEELLEDPTAPENILKPRGRGVFLMNQFVDEVSFVHEAPGRFGVVMKVALGQSSDKED